MAEADVHLDGFQQTRQVVLGEIRQRLFDVAMQVDRELLLEDSLDHPRIGKQLEEWHRAGRPLAQDGPAKVLEVGLVLHTRPPSGDKGAQTPPDCWTGRPTNRRARAAAEEASGA
jgi:hypothetical protein